VDQTALLAYLVAASALMVLPGPDWAFVVAVGSRERVVVPVAVGLGMGYVLMALVVAAGVGPLVAAAPAALVVIAVAGASYLVHLGIGIWRSAGHPPAGDSTAVPSGASAIGAAQAGQLLWRGVGVSALNPKSLVLFVAFLPQFVRTSAPWPITVQLAVLGLVWAGIGAAFYTVLGFTARRAIGSQPDRARVVQRVTGAAMVLGGIALACEQLLHVT
jgi:threonine/homoserine/homoserine lactone efflux protein